MNGDYRYFACRMKRMGHHYAVCTLVRVMLMRLLTFVKQLPLTYSL